jgi:hypothetical protein
VFISIYIHRQITARDRGEPPKSKIEHLFIKIRDKNDHGPVFDSKQYSAAIPENSSVGMNVLQVCANGLILFVLSSNNLQPSSLLTFTFTVCFFAINM